MKKLALLALLTMVAAGAHAQIRKSATLLGGAFSYVSYQSRDDSHDVKSASGHFVVSAGRAFRENAVAGLAISYIPLNYKEYQSGGDSLEKMDNRTAFGVFYRQYRPLAKNLYVFGQADAEVFFGTYRETFPAADRNVTARQKGGSVSLSAGVSYQIFKRVQLEVSVPDLLNIQYLVRNTDKKPGETTDPKYTQFLVSSSFSDFRIGFLSGGFRILL